MSLMFQLRQLQNTLDTEADEIFGQEEYTSEEKAYAEGLRRAQALIANLLHEETERQASYLTPDDYDSAQY